MAAHEPGTSCRRAGLGAPAGTAQGPLSAGLDSGQGRRATEGMPVADPDARRHWWPLGTGSALSGRPATHFPEPPKGPSFPRPLPHAPLALAQRTRQVSSEPLRGTSQLPMEGPRELVLRSR